MDTSTILVALFMCFLAFLFHYWIRKKNSPIVNWPVVGMLPGILCNMFHVHEYLTKVLIQSGGTYEFKGPWFCNMDFVFTCDPMNIHHILSKSFLNYQKGPKFHTIFEPLGDGILAADADSWTLQRKMIHSYFKDTKFQLFLERTIQEKVVKNLFPVLDHVCMHEKEVDLEDVIGRLGFEIICSLILGYDPKCLTVDFPKVASEKAINAMEEAVLHRHVKPEMFWKLEKWLQIGQEKKLSAAWKSYDQFVYHCISSKRQKFQQEPETSFDFLTAYLTEEEAIKEGNKTVVSDSNKFLRDAATSLVIAGRDTSSAAIAWFFWLLAKNPSVETKIREEMRSNLQFQDQEKDGKSGLFRVQELNKLVYLHAALCETLRLYPSLPINHKASLQPETLPSGHRVGANTKIFTCHYSMGRMRDVWGEDCLEFKPERWISKQGGIVHVPSYKFVAFSAGPRSCPGKDMGFIQMKIIAVAVLLNYRIQVIENHPVSPCNSVLLHMKHGFKVKLTKTSLQ